jgi:hypothetical protein
MSCDDGDDCTHDACTGGVCVHDPVPDCGTCVPTPEVCDDGIDNDCDELADCSDPDCATAPSCNPPVEVCDDCVDNDGDGLVDFEDPDCCPDPMLLTLRRVRLAPTTVNVRGNRLNLTGVYAPSPPPSFDPLRWPTSLQLSDQSGQLFCASIPAGEWRRRTRATLSFRDPGGAAAGGLSSGSFTVMRAGSVTFRAHGGGARIAATDGRSVQITVGVGGQCSRAATALFPVRRGFVFPMPTHRVFTR